MAYCWNKAISLHTIFGRFAFDWDRLNDAGILCRLFVVRSYDSRPI